MITPDDAFYTFELMTWQAVAFGIAFGAIVVALSVVAWKALRGA